MRILIDTNVIIDALATRKPFNVSAEKIILLASEKRVETFITASTVTDIYYLIQKHLKDTNRAKEILKTLFRIIDIINVDKNSCIKALDLDMPDYEDALLATCAKKVKADFIVTRNLKDFENSPVKTILPDEFISTIDNVN